MREVGSNLPSAGPRKFPFSGLRLLRVQSAGSRAAWHPCRIYRRPAKVMFHCTVRACQLLSALRRTGCGALARAVPARMFCARGSHGGAFVRTPPARGHVGNTKGCRTALRVRLQVRAPQLLASRTELCSKLGHRLSQSLCIALANACRVCGCGSLLHCAGARGLPSRC